MNTYNEIIANEKIDLVKLETAQKIILRLQDELQEHIAKGHGPFLAAIYDAEGNLIAKAANSVVMENCSHNHAEMNTIKKAEEALQTYDLSSYNLSLYVTSEPCIMCLGGIMWSGIKAVYYGVTSKNVEKITGFDEGFKPDWLAQFKKRGIVVYGNIEAKVGEKVLKDYVNKGNTIYKPERKRL
mgnify:CR=1 FL=1